jgi:hypothetical protein
MKEEQWKCERDYIPVRHSETRPEVKIGWCAALRKQTQNDAGCLAGTRLRAEYCPRFIPKAKITVPPQTGFRFPKSWITRTMDSRRTWAHNAHKEKTE